ncbi:MAG TPA: hypothetical protein VGX91_10280 [Candidatus Cybelea sp.]|nr:hypothetical protein [Candidatus Cybelea sp.]
MISSFLGTGRLNLALIAVGVAAITVSACSTDTGSGTSSLSHNLARAVTPATFTWKWQSVGDTSAGSNTEITGINNLTSSNAPEIVGFSYGSTTTFHNSFTSLGPHYTSFADANFPRVGNGSTGTQMNAIQPAPGSSPYPTLAGFVSMPADSGPGDVYAALENQGLWSLSEVQGAGLGGQGGANAGYLYGINDSHVSVGYFVSKISTSSSATTPPEAYQVVPGVGATNVPFPASWKATNSVAYGINDAGDMAGTAIATINSSSGAQPVAWYALCYTICNAGNSTSASYCWQTLGSSDFGKKTSTYVAYGINSLRPASTRQIVGSYEDSSNHTHGFLANVTGPATSGSPCVTETTQYPIDAQPNTKTTPTLTVVRGINNAGYIVGWYTSGKGITLGFVGEPVTGATKRRP